MSVNRTFKDVTDGIQVLVLDAEKRGYERGDLDGYQRGVDETMKRIQQVVFGETADAKPASAPAPNVSCGEFLATDSNDKEDDNKRKRAPKGLARKVIIRELQRRPGLTPSEIATGATADLEKMIADASYRSELRKGRGDDRYRYENGKWFLVDEAKTEVSPESNPSVFE